MEVCSQLHVPAAVSQEIPRAPWIAGWVDPTSGLDILEGRKISAWIQTLDRPARRLVTILTTFCDFINSFNTEYLIYFNPRNAVMFKPQMQHNICAIVCYFLENKKAYNFAEHCSCAFLIIPIANSNCKRNCQGKNSTSSAPMPCFKGLFVIHSAYSEGVRSSNTQYLEWESSELEYTNYSEGVLISNTQ